MLRLASLAVVIDGISSVPGGLLAREFRQGRRATAEWLGFAVSTGLTVFLAANGFGSVEPRMGSNRRKHRQHDRPLRARELPTGPGLGSRGRQAAQDIRASARGFSLLLFAMLNADYLIVGRVSGTVALGLYTLAFNLSSWPSSILSGTMRRVSVPTFSGSGTIRRSWSVRSRADCATSPC